MPTIYDLEQLEKPPDNPVLTIGNFDGVHTGHLALFNKVKERARYIGGQSCVMTFDPHPLKVLNSESAPPLITPIEQKLSLIEKAGIDVIFCLPFTEIFAATSATDFIRDILVRKISIKQIVVGYDYTFGNKREGNISLLEEMGRDHGFAVHVVEQVRIDRTLVSSTIIRNLILEGDLTKARKLLGRHYQICGTVVKGRNRGGRLLGFPTANLKMVDELIPKRGVYAVHVLLGNQMCRGVTNVGYNPTFGDEQLSVETHLLDFSGDLVGETLRLNFLERLRPEKTFESVDELARQIDLDIMEAKKIFPKIEEKDAGLTKNDS